MIRLATAQDADGIWLLLQEAFRTGDTYAVDPQISRADALAMWCDAPAATYVYIQDGQIIGTYYIKTNQQGGGAHICNCGYIVSADARGQGVAAQMCEDSQARARDLGYKAMQYNLVVTTNVGAVHLWTKLGFATVGTIPQAFDHPTAGLVDALVMYKPL